MYKVARTIIKPNGHTSGLYEYLDNYAHLAKNLKNAVIFRVRQIYTGYYKTNRTPNEQEVFDEVAKLEKEYPNIKVKRDISYNHLEKLMRVNNNPDFFAGLPMQTSQAILKEVVQNFKSWHKASAEYDRHPEKFTGKPKIPGYIKNDIAEFTFTNQDAVVYLNDNDIPYMKLPKTKETMLFPQASPSITKQDSKSSVIWKEGYKFAEVKVIPYYGRYIIASTIEIPDIVKNDNKETCATDLGVNNFASIVCTDGSSRLYKGGAVLSDIQWFMKKSSDYTSAITKGHKGVSPHSKRLTNLSYHHSCFSNDQLHKISRSIVDFCIEHNAGTLIIGVNKYWKQYSNIGKKNNQKFVAMPITRLREMITYKATMAGITVIEQEESYTSKADITTRDYMPVYGSGEKVTFSGKRISRGLYRCSDGTIINADLNGAANIMRKAIPSIWGDRTSFSFLSSPEVFGFHELNPSSNPVKRIAGL